MRPRCLCAYLFYRHGYSGAYLFYRHGVLVVVLPRAAVLLLLLELLHLMGARLVAVWGDR